MAVLPPLGPIQALGSCQEQPKAWEPLWVPPPSPLRGEILLTPHGAPQWEPCPAPPGPLAQNPSPSGGTTSVAPPTPPQKPLGPYLQQQQGAATQRPLLTAGGLEPQRPPPPLPTGGSMPHQPHPGRRKRRILAGNYF